MLATYFVERSMNIAAVPPRTLNVQIPLLFRLILAGSTATPHAADQKTTSIGVGL